MDKITIAQYHISGLLTIYWQDIFMVLLVALVGGWISRMCGGGKPKLPWGLDQWIYALPYGACLALFAPTSAIVS